MWPFKRKADDQPPTLTSLAGPGHAWRDLPPIQRLSGDLTPVAEPDRFHDSLTTWKSPGMLEPLGHYVTPSAPSGVVHEVPTHSVRQFAEPPLVARMLSTRAPATIATPAVSPSPPQSPRPDAPPPVRHVLPIVDKPAVVPSRLEPSPPPEVPAPEAESPETAADDPNERFEPADSELARVEHQSEIREADSTGSTEVQRIAEAPLVGEKATPTSVVDFAVQRPAAEGPAPKRIGLGLPISRSVDSPPPTARPTGVLGLPMPEPPVVEPVDVHHPQPAPLPSAEASPQPVAQRSTSESEAAAGGGDEPVEEPADVGDPTLDISEGVHPTLGVETAVNQPAPMASAQPDPSPQVEPPVVRPRATVEYVPIEPPEASGSHAEHVAAPPVSKMPVASRQAEDQPPNATRSGTPQMQSSGQPSSSEATAPFVGDPTATISPTVQEEVRATPDARSDSDEHDRSHLWTEQPLVMPVASTTESAMAPSPSVQMERSLGDEPSERPTVEPLGLVPTLGMPATPGIAGPTAIVNRVPTTTSVRLPTGTTDVSESLSPLGDRRWIPTQMTVAPATRPPAAVQRGVEAVSPVPSARLAMDPNHARRGVAPRAFEADGVALQPDVVDYAQSDVIVQRAVDDSSVWRTAEFDGAGSGVDPGVDIGSDVSVQRAAGGAATGSSGGGGADLDELARKLYGRIRVHLRNELRLDRERSGSLVETRR